MAAEGGGPLPAAQADMLDLASPEMAGIEQVLLRACGVSLASGLRGTLRNGICAAAEALHVDPHDLVERLLSEDPASVAALIEHSVVGETHFYRHPEQLSAIARQVAHASAPLSIWSAGCATGEEPYSLAMALIEAGRPAGRDRILATDVSEQALARARDGVYGNWSMRRLDADLADRYFVGTPPAARVTPKVRNMVEFRRHNLVAEPVPGRDFDVILCRNVLIYFERPTAAEVLARLLDAVRPGGLLVLGPVELPLAAPLWVEWIESGDASLLRKPVEPARPISRSFTGGGDE